MALIGKIVTLFADKEKTSPRFPRTKVSAVSDENGVGLDVLLEETKNAVNNIDLSAYATKSELETIQETAMPKTNFVLDGTTLTITL